MNKMREFWRRRRRTCAVVLAAATATFLLLLVVVFSNEMGVIFEHLSTDGGRRGGDHRTPPFSPPRKLLVGRSLTVMEPDRIWGEKCTSADIVINQGPTNPLPTGVPSYTVEIVNTCVTGCDISEIHLRCGWFSSARLINPKIFKRLRYNDCVVNDGKTLVNGGTLSFEYANTYLYPLTVSKVICA